MRKDEEKDEEKDKEEEKKDKGMEFLFTCIKTVISSSYTQVRCTFGGCIKQTSQPLKTSLCHPICSRVTS